MYLSRLILNPRSRQVQGEVGKPYQLHRTLLTHGFGTTREASGVLYRLDLDRQGITVLVQSLVEPDWQGLLTVGQGQYLLAPPPAPKTFEATFAQGRRFYFRLRANPTVKKAREEKRQGNRVPLKHEAQQIAWLHRKGAQGGFRVLDVRASQDEEQRDRIRHEQNHERDERGSETSHTLTLYTVQFDGLLEVTDTERFREAVRSGIGPAKAFGCGLLSLARA
ncbi:MAG: type I-E CRISPR-associated protein Cas6/Cse3/CasE [Ardenticatenaceae bacterium]|nr:type I-E CRISPR-associated protein Cas6/Cse3/CasE [Ardenticatenaceae bacterium]